MFLAFIISFLLATVLSLYFIQTRKLLRKIDKLRTRNKNLLEEKRFLYQVLDNAPEILWATDMDGTYLLSEGRGLKYLNRKAGESVGLSTREIYKDYPQVLAFINNALRGETVSEQIEVFGRMFDIRVSPWFDERGKQIGLLGVSFDITDRIAMQQKLRESEEKFRTFVDMLPQAVFELDAQGRSRFMNKTGMKAFGIDDSTFSTPAVDFFIPEDRERMRANLARKFPEQNRHQLSSDFMPDPSEYTVMRPDGTTFPVIIYTSPIIENGTFNGSRGIIVDISERKALENAVRESENKYKALVESSQDGICIIQKGYITFANDAFCRMQGFTAEEIYSREAIEFVAPESRPLMERLRDLRINGDATQFNYDLKFIRKNGEIAEAEVFASTIQYQGMMAGFYTVHDISENRKMQEALKQSEEKYRELVNSLPQTIFEIDNDGRLTFCNQSGFDSFRSSEADYGRPADDFFIPEENHLIWESFNKISLQTNGSYTFEYTALRADGSSFPALIYAQPIIRNNERIGTRGVILDITQRKSTEKALKRSEEKYRTLIEKTLDGIIITQNGRLKFMNKAICEMMQYSEDELIDRPFLKFVVPEMHSEMIDVHKRRMAGDQFQTLYCSQVIRKDGTIIDIELNSRTSDFNGHPAAFIVVRNISDRIKTEQELRIAKNDLEALNHDLEARIHESSQKLTEINTQLIRLQKENLQSQFEVLRQQVNPHFLFNSLNVLTSLIKLEPDLAEKFTEHLSKVYRYVLENKDNEFVSLYTELDFLEAYLFLLDIRFMDKLKVNINIPDAMKNYQIIPLAMQLLIENAIKHNAMSKKRPLVIDIFIDSRNWLNVVNNLQERESHMASTGVGLKNIENRYRLLNNTMPEFEKADSSFIARIPLVESIKYSDSN
ncbi:MAG: PAS domain S-box protein [Bacteroidota bacterium]|nr:PAS domain S-box protein [Bacteroidota bacterium]